ncbi:sigma-54 interaction domain-containing protein [Candidatus Nitrospira inopinata]|uniref:Sensory sigma-54 dependent transcriptional regulator n=1 Tax=Candidatus Nitrospira inopinata TaxID=1715989 RepID=A0A0S4KTP8_9BACT|nr:sigma 54-interacting transcriptional regulator [Candidatus Nitrospira inopinata]CUQ65707.1 Sensory sigma-54 dependent transcriptional regulator [Candidatus Nitrospira inopinata]
MSSEQPVWHRHSAKEGDSGEQGHVPPFRDPILLARLEAITQLAGGLTDRVAVMDRHFNVVYANGPAWSSAAAKESESQRAKCYEAFAHRSDPCGTCPAIKVFEAPDVRSVSCSIGGDGTACGMHQAFPLVTGEGDVGSMLVLFKDERERTASGQVSPEQESGPGARDSLGELIGRSPAMQRLFDMVALVAESSATVLIQGESGTGKELLAKTIHALSRRKDKPFIVVDCGALPETLLESELFGHVKGAFTGAVANKRGLFEEADSGTIFLDEIADTTPVFQAKLLRVLQEGEIRPVGGTKPIKVDVRVISATNRDLTDLVKEKAFRQDLYYRLAVLPLYVPPLRDRREDIPLLAEHFIARSCRRHQQPVRTLSDRAKQALSKAAWPGNVRELQHYIERAVVTTAGSAIDCDDLIILDAPDEGEDLRSATRGVIAQTERARIVDTLKKTGGNRAKAAKLLKISRASLYNKLRAYGIE